MSYLVGQYNFVSGSTSEDFLSVVGTGCKATRYPGTKNSGVTSLDEEYPFDEECLYYEDSFKTGQTYYLHCRILQLDTNQTFYIKLMHMDDVTENQKESQFIKKIVIQKNSIGSVTYNFDKEDIEVNSGNNWVDLELIFTPIKDFDSLVFDLVRSVDAGDYQTDQVRHCCIIYDELSVVNNPINIFNNNDYTVVKIGIQSHPGLLMAINNEDIKIGRAGSYELRSGLLNGINSFAVLQAQEDSGLTNAQSDLATYMTKQIYLQRGEPIAYQSIQTYDIISKAKYDSSSKSIKNLYNPVYIDGTYLLGTWSEGSISPSSKSRIGIIEEEDGSSVTKTRTTSSFVLDYMYKEVETEE